MAKLFYPDFFNDVFGPIMQPGSSGSFAGTSRVGRIARATLKSEPKRVRILFNPSDHHLRSLGNMMDDRAYLAGLLDYPTDDINLFYGHERAREKGISYEFGERDNDNKWPGSVTFELTGEDGDTSTFVGQSVGGGMVTSYEIHGFPIAWQADTYAVLVWGDDTRVLRSTERVFSETNADYVQVTFVPGKGSVAALYEFSQQVDREAVGGLFPESYEIRFLPALLPVVTTKERKPQLFTTCEEWRKVAEDRGISFLQAAIEYEKNFSGWDDSKVWAYFEKIDDILYDQVHSLEKMGYENAVDTPNLPIYGKFWDRYAASGRILEDPLTARIIRSAMSVNAKIPGVKIVPGPMGTGGGYLYSAIDAVAEHHHLPREKRIESLIIAAAIGAIAFTHCHASGASGCVGASGICCAMGSAAVTWLGGGDGMQVENAASMAIQANLGIPCDPIPGGKEFPCITRTVRAAVTAPLYADLALAGIDPLIPYHETLHAIEENRKKLGCVSCGECTALHYGINAAPAAKACQEQFQSVQMAERIRYEANA